MAPTRQENASEMAYYVDQRSTLSAESVRVPQLSTNHEKRSEMCARLARRTYPCYRQQMIPDLGLESRQAASHPVVAITGTEVLSSVEVTAVLPNPVSLHANIIPLSTLLPSTTTSSSLLHLKEPSSAQIALIIAGALVGVIVASFGMMILVAQFSWSFRGLKLYHRRSSLKEGHVLGKGMSFIKTGCDTTCATATCVVHTLDSEFLKELKTTSNLARNSRPVQRSFNCALPSTLAEQSANNPPGQPIFKSDWNREDSQESLQIEEKDIAIALVAALRDWPSSWDVEPDATDQSLALARNRAEVLPRSRSSQGSDASTSQETTTTDFIECFSSASFSFRSSIASCSSIVTSFDEEWSAYEVKRALTQSLEMKKGVLVAIPDIPSATLGSPLSLISREIRPSSAITELLDISLAEGRCAGLQHVPYLVVTCPSTSTIITLNSIDSSISVDLGDFPLPPSLIKPTVG